LAILTSIGFKLTEDKMAETTTRDELLYQMIVDGMNDATTGDEQKIVLDALQALPEGDAKTELIGQFYQDYDGMTEANKDLLDTSSAYLNMTVPEKRKLGAQINFIGKQIAGGYGQRKARVAQDALSADRSAVTDFTGRSMIDARNAPKVGTLGDSGMTPNAQPQALSQALNSQQQVQAGTGGGPGGPTTQQMPPTLEASALTANSSNS
jgi:hypothetical protein